MTAVTPELLRRFDVPGPRYTSFPTADRFVEAFGAEDYILALEHRKSSTAARAMPLSLYVHVPFCESLCYCACNKIVTRHHDRAAVYLDYLAREMALHTAHCGKGQAVSQLHLGGGTPTFFSDDELRTLMALLREHFKLEPGGEYSIEVDPRTVSVERLAVLKELGFNRLSFGVQDFDEQVQIAVHRVQPAEQVFALVAAARRAGLCLHQRGPDLRPAQADARVLRAHAGPGQCAAADRIALYAYAHLPERFKPQRRIAAEDLPQGADKLAMLSRSIAAFMDGGYVYVGMDHFALPEDALAVAKRQGRLHRNFQGYSTQPDCDLIALGVSAIGKVGASYSQNAKTLEEYYDAIDAGHLPVVRGLALSRDDLVRRAVIMAIMCQGAVLFEPMEQAWLLGFREYFAPELAALQDLQAKGLVQISDEGFQVTPMGWYFVRGVAMLFDRYLQADKNRARFSRII